MGTSWHLAEGVSCLIESFRSGLLSDCQAAQPSPLAGASVHLHSEAALTSLCCNVCDDWSIIPICHRVSVSIPFRSYTCQCLAIDCAFDISVARRQSDGSCQFYVHSKKWSLKYSNNICVTSVCITNLICSQNYSLSYLWMSTLK